jgi:hypothetical protein
VTVPELNIPTCPESILGIFPKQKCFVFDQPKYAEELLAHMEDVIDNQLDSKFQEQSRSFCSYIFTHGRTKTLREGIQVTGNCEFPFSS